MSNPLLSICCITYNHELYLRDAINGFLLQKTNFPIEIIIHDDASTDKSAKIIQEYAKKDDRIIPILRKKNIRSTGVAVFPLTFQIARGKYIALCEGDDFWTDPYKLQKQVDFLELNPNYSISFHAAEYKDFKANISRIHSYKCENGFATYDVKKVILSGGGFMTTNSIVFRTKFIRDFPDWIKKGPTGDYPLAILLASFGDVGYFADCMSVYRMGVSNSWSEKSRNPGYQHKWLIGTNRMLHGFNKWTGYKYSWIVIKMQIINLWRVYKYILKCFLTSQT